MRFPALLVLAASPLALAASIHDARDHTHVQSARLPKRWFHGKDHPVATLFRRGDDGQKRPEVGSPEWAAKYPAIRPDENQLPKEWTDALDAAVKAGKIPTIAPSIANVPEPDTVPAYAAGVNPLSPEVCAAAAKCRNTADHWDAPDGVFVSSFDDGPQPGPSGILLDFLTKNNVKATHFMIGINIKNNPNEFLQAFNAGNDIAVHTYNHPHMTTLSNQGILAQLGWTMQIIYDSTGGRVPRYWRPPYGDTDERVRAIAIEVFGLETVVWNFDTFDWQMTTGARSPETVAADLKTFITGSKVKGLNILEHEISEKSVNAFIGAFPLIAQNGWKFASLASALGEDPYQNAESSTSANVDKAGILDFGQKDDPATSKTVTTLSTTTTSTPAVSTPATTTITTTTTTQSSQTQQPSSGASTNQNSAKSQESSFWTLAIALSGVIAGSLL